MGIMIGGDPLGADFSIIRSPVMRRAMGATYMPPAIVDAMIAWTAEEGETPARVVDPGAGSGRYLRAAAQQYPKATLVAVEIDPLAALILRANAAVLGFADRLQMQVEDYRAISLPNVNGPTLFIGLIAVNDANSSAVIRLPAIDAVGLTRKFPARFSFNDPDPQIGIPSLAAFSAKEGSGAAMPIITGAKGGNAALGSLITALAGLGLVIDNTTA